MRTDQRDDEKDVDGSSLDSLGSIFYEIIDEWYADCDKSELLLPEGDIGRHYSDDSYSLDDSDGSAVFYNANMAYFHLDQNAEDTRVQDTLMMIRPPHQELQPEGIILDRSTMMIDQTHHDDRSEICLETPPIQPQDVLVWHGGIMDDPIMYNNHGGNHRLREIAGREPFKSHYGLATNDAIKQEVLTRIQNQVHTTTDGHSVRFLVLLEDDRSRYRLATQNEINEEIRRSIRHHFSTRPRANDVLFGRGFRCREFEGNVRLRAFIDNHRSEYKAAGRDRRRRLVQEAREYVEEVGGGRFLLPFDQGRPLEYCTLAPDDAINRKIAHQYREKRRRSIMNRYTHFLLTVMCRSTDKSAHKSTTGSGYTFSSPEFSNALTFGGYPCDLNFLPHGSSNTANVRLGDNSRLFLGIIALDMSMESMEHLFEMAPAELSSFQPEQTGSDKVLAKIERTHPLALGALEELHRNMNSLVGSFGQLYEQCLEDVVARSYYARNHNNGSATCMATNPVGKPLSVESPLLTPCPTNHRSMLNVGAIERPSFAALIGDNDQFSPLNPDVRFDELESGKVNVLGSAATITFEGRVRKRNSRNFIVVAPLSSLVQCVEKQCTTFGKCADLEFCVTNSTTPSRLVSQEFQGRPIPFSVSFSDNIVALNDGPRNDLLSGSVEISIARSRAWFHDNNDTIGTKPQVRESLALVTRDDDPLWSKHACCLGGGSENKGRQRAGPIIVTVR